MENAIEFRVSKQAGLIDANFDELNRQVRIITEKYANLVYSEAQLGEAKTDLADLRAKRKAIDDNRKSVKSEYMKPYEAFEAKVKETLAIFDEAIGNIDGQVKHAEEMRKAEKRRQIEDWWKLNGVKTFNVPIEKVWDERLLNKTVTTAQWQKTLSDKAKSIEADLDVILKYPVDMMNYIVPIYRNTLDMHGAVRAWEEHKRAEEETRAVREAEIARRNAEMQKREEEVKKVEIVQEKPNTELKTYWHINFEIDGDEAVVKELSNTLRQLKAKGLWFKVISKESREEK